MNRVRGILMLVAALFAFYRGWKFHTGHYALMAYGWECSRSAWPHGT